VFESGIQKEKTSGNLDFPEDLFGALMQAVVCREAINWTENAWHLIVVATDATFHSAGDGKLAGIYTPNDGLCHLDSNGRYNLSTEQDYPSVSHIRKVLIDNQVYPIFAVTSDRFELYKALQDTLRDTRGFVGTLASDSKNVLTLIQEGYEAIASEVSLTANIRGDDLVSADIKAVSCPG
jgi:protocadherin alpha